MALVLNACGSDDDGGRPKSDASNGQLEFGGCPADLPGTNRGRACAVTDVPLRWDEPNGEKIELLVARYASDTPQRGQLWLLDGGPGGTGAVYMLDEVLALYASLGLDVYVPQHRGTGYSTPLGCSDVDALRACGNELLATWGDGLRGFHSTQAGRDLGFLIDLTHDTDEPVFVFGLSYGTYWAQRYLQAYPRQANGVILEGVFPLGQTLSDSDPLADAAGRSIFQACRDEPECAEAFGAMDPEDVARSVVTDAGVPERRCFGEAGLGRTALELVLAELVIADLAHVIPGFMQRLHRCNADDQSELLALGALLGELLADDIPASVDNQVLGVHVIRSDILSSVSTLPLDELLLAREPLVFWSGAAFVEEFAEIVESWPVNYPPASAALEGIETPVLLLNGGLDIQTPSPWARELATTLGGTLVEFPFAGHAVDISLASPLTAGDASCSLGIQRAFIENPHGAIDASCAANAYRPDVAGLEASTRAVASALYGRETTLLARNAGAPQPKRRFAGTGEREARASVETLRQRLRQANRERPRFSYPKPSNLPP